ncbi:hypothetical protein [Aquamicrobium zhengzhouense]|uniref:Uncharacterized protein n=1 Tax=Aquamicrobium zhengzhouense TaxID=2781738 RepID=A0ABS0SHG9_9HYPH|nr:hypothetical protein [Aquamicrobium zhengzhouense]MBI1622754.1 hypothetical protein [Aquamicrobium zhengzhouense]
MKSTDILNFLTTDFILPRSLLRGSSPLPLAYGLILCLPSLTMFLPTHILFNDAAHHIYDATNILRCRWNNTADERRYTKRPGDAPQNNHIYSPNR